MCPFVLSTVDKSIRVSWEISFSCNFDRFVDASCLGRVRVIEGHFSSVESMYAVERLSAW